MEDIIIQKRTDVVYLQDTYMTEKSHPELGWTLASSYRQTILLALKDNALCPTEIAKKTKHYQPHVSKTLRELTMRNLVVCLNPNDRKGKLYELTQDGEKVCAQLACHSAR